MQQKELRDATGSDPLTLSEEYAMQESWREDENSNDIFCANPKPFILDLPMAL